MAIYDSYLESGLAIVHAVLGNGMQKVDEIRMLIMNKHNNACIICLFSIAWFAFQVRGWYLITILSKLLFYSMLFLLVWSQAAEARLINWSPPRFDEIMISESKVISVFKKIKGLLAKFYHAAQGKDFKLLVITLIALALLPCISDYFSLPTFLYIAFLCWQIVPMLRQT
ncbi:Reticulon - like 9 [Theobroma cacao]|nr:Reticulon - like 9 [Theobroma cacao]